jgi:hypothetical protein
MQLRGSGLRFGWIWRIRVAAVYGDPGPKRVNRTGPQARSRATGMARADKDGQPQSESVLQRSQPNLRRARYVPDRGANSGMERTTADTSRSGVDLRTHGQGGSDEPVPKLTVRVQFRCLSTIEPPEGKGHQPPSRAAY